MRLHIGFDDTDSPHGGCTTYVAALLVEHLSRIGATFIDYPNLIRLNPNAPWKTRGNGALCLRIEVEDALLDEVVEVVNRTVEEHSELDYEGTDPGVVFLSGQVPEELKRFAKRTIQGIVALKEAVKLAERFCVDFKYFKKGRGIIGGLAAVGEELKGDHTFEVIAYRTPQNRGTPRRVDEASILEMDSLTKPLTFNNIDPETGRILITPRGPDPILWGIRGETAEIVRKAQSIAKALEKVERWVIFRTNHGTDAHLRRVNSISEVKPFNPVIVRGTVKDPPHIIPRRHVIFSIEDGTGSVDCAAYAPTGALRKAVALLVPGDLVEVYGGVRPPSNAVPLTINLEKLRIVHLKPLIEQINPLCPVCGSRTESMGRGKGLRCKKCGYRSKNLKKVNRLLERPLKEALYVTSPRSQRHLTKPLSRYGREKNNVEEPMIKEWHSPLNLT